MFAVLRQRNFALLWLAGLVSQLGDWVLGITLPFYVYTRTGSALATGAMFAIETIPRLLFGSLAGVFADRWNRRTTMIVCDLARATLLLLLFTVSSQNWLWLVYLVAFVETIFGLLFDPSQAALTPTIVSKEDLLQANALSQVSANAVRLSGPLLGGALFALLGLNSVILVDITSYLISALCIASISIAGKQRVTAIAQDKQGETSARLSLWQEWLAGFRFIVQKRWLLVLLITAGIAMIGQGVFNVLLVVFVKQILHGNAQAYGLLASAQGIGGILGGLLVGKFGKRLPPARLLAFSLMLTGILVIVQFSLPILYLDALLSALAGLPVVGWIAGLSTMFQRGVADAYRGRIGATFSTTQILLMLSGMGLASILAEPLGVVPVLILGGILLILAGMLVFGLLHNEEGQEPVEERLSDSEKMV